MTRVTWLILGLWAVALAAFFVIARPAPAPTITYRADPTIAAWVDAAAAAEARASRVELKPAGGGGEPN
ncbi:MAG TPA: hypothetical protein VHL09_10195, partial [Dehalococcoidia bacterium]|nr:hypothetical protein [Dehalococcoidia bacterium]